MERHRPTSDPVTVTRIGTQVVVRLSGLVDDRHADRLAAAVDEVAALVLRRVVVDLDDVDGVEGAGLGFLGTLHERWTLRCLNAPVGLRHRLPGPGRAGEPGPTGRTVQAITMPTSRAVEC